jgi:hypothetical protein
VTLDAKRGNEGSESRFGALRAFAAKWRIEKAHGGVNKYFAAAICGSSGFPTNTSRSEPHARAEPEAAAEPDLDKAPPAPRAHQQREHRPTMCAALD